MRDARPVNLAAAIPLPIPCQNGLSLELFELDNGGLFDRAEFLLFHAKSTNSGSSMFTAGQPPDKNEL
jgi:hypothetical protein